MHARTVCRGSVNDMHHQPPTLRWTKRKRRDPVMGWQASFPFQTFETNNRPHARARASTGARACDRDFATLLNGDSVRRARSETRQRSSVLRCVADRTRERTILSLGSCKPTDPRSLLVAQTHQLRIAPYLLRTVGCRGKNPVYLLSWTRLREDVSGKTSLPPTLRTPSGH